MKKLFLIITLVSCIFMQTHAQSLLEAAAQTQTTHSSVLVPQLVFGGLASWFVYKKYVSPAYKLYSSFRNPIYIPQQREQDPEKQKQQCLEIIQSVIEHLFPRNNNSDNDVRNKPSLLSAATTAIFKCIPAICAGYIIGQTLKSDLVPWSSVRNVCSYRIVSSLIVPHYSTQPTTADIATQLIKKSVWSVPFAIGQAYR